MNPNQQRAVEIAREVMNSLRIKAGQSEKEISARIISEIKRRGAEPSFPVIVASGVRSIDPHAKPSKNKIKNGEQVMVDLGAKYKGYCSDITRMFFVGKPTKKYLHYYNIVKTAQKMAIAAVRDGAYCRDIDLTARTYIKRLCFKACHIKEKDCPGECFIHTTGHGVGKKIHQSPRISLKSRAKLKSGMVITVEPGIYIKGWGGIRIEDMVLVTNKGCQVLTNDH
ncbi:MAG: M24 family metallopeptidase [Candidatus Margulisbacteria bacterium]|nr:M24 family metallopeptidase [Candidatus Margulisiibacteriota bacterium]MBU1616793.1 M24 family metallopeptidase [Candidatus Margulisiibacteriota bacterium]